MIRRVRAGLPSGGAPVAAEQDSATCFRAQYGKSFASLTPVAADEPLFLVASAGRARTRAGPGRPRRPIDIEDVAGVRARLVTTERHGPSSTSRIASAMSCAAWLADNGPGPEPSPTTNDHYAHRRNWQRTPPTVAGPPSLAVGVRRTRRDADAFGDLMEALGRAGMPLPANVLGPPPPCCSPVPLSCSGATTIRKKRYRNPIVTAEEIWCQGFSSRVRLRSGRR